MAVSELDEKKNFLKHIPGDRWPVDLEVSRQNMLRYIVLVCEIKSKIGNEHDILPTLLELLQKYNSHLAKAIGESFKIERESSIPTEQAANTTDDMSYIYNDFVDHHDKSDNEEDKIIPESTAVNICEDKQHLNDQTEISTPVAESCPPDANVFSNLSSRRIMCHNCR